MYLTGLPENYGIISRGFKYLPNYNVELSSFFKKFISIANNQEYHCIRCFSPKKIVDPKVLLIVQHGLKKEPTSKKVENLVEIIEEKDILIIEGDNFVINKKYLPNLSLQEKSFYYYIKNYFSQSIPALYKAFKKAKLVIAKDNVELGRALEEFNNFKIRAPDEEFLELITERIKGLRKGLEHLENKMFVVQSLGSIVQMPHIPFILEKENVSYAIFSPRKIELFGNDLNISQEHYDFIQKQCGFIDYRSYQSIEELPITLENYNAF